MAVDSLEAAQLFRKIRYSSLKKQAFDPSIPHEIMQNEIFDPSLSNRLVYGNRADWYVAAAVGGFCDVDMPIERGLRFYPMPSEFQPKVKLGLY